MSAVVSEEELPNEDDAKEIKVRFPAQDRRLGHENQPPTSILGHPPAQLWKTKTWCEFRLATFNRFAVEVCAESTVGFRLA